MTPTESHRADESFARAMERARAYLDAPPPRRRAWPVLAAAAFFAVSSLLFATAAILAPAVGLDPPPSRTATAPAGSFGPPLAGAIN